MLLGVIMSVKTYRNGGYIYTKKGHVLSQTRAESENKYYAVITRCGHCGDGYFMPIMFQIYARSVDAAIAEARTFPRVRSHKKDAIIDAFEISPEQALFIQFVNDVDPYLNGYAVEDDDFTRNRRVALEPKSDYEYNKRSDSHQKEADEIKTANEYVADYVLERYCAPIREGDHYVYPKSIHRNAFIKDYFNEKCYRNGIHKGRPHFLSVYYQIYGKDNDLGLQVDAEKKIFICPHRSGNITYVDIPEQIYVILEETGCFYQTPSSFEEYDNNSPINVKNVRVPTGLERFKKKYPHLVNPDQNQPGGG